MALFLAPLVVMMLCQAFPWAGRALAAAISGIVVPNKVTTGNTASQFPVADANEVQGGFHQLQYSSELRDIPEARRKRGMFVFCADSGKIYQLYSSPGHWWRHYNPVTDISKKLDVEAFSAYTSTALQAALARYTALQAWAQAELDKKTDKEVFDKHTSAQYQAAQGPPGTPGYTPVHGTDYFDGRDGHSYSCNITGGVRGVSYDADGKNPQPTTLGTFMANMYRDAEELVATSWEWFIAAIGTHLTSPPQEQDGSQNRHQYFQPGVQGSYSANRSNNYISVMVGYSSSQVPHGKFYCTASIPITVTKTGIQGIQGIQGPPGESTEQSIVDIFANTASGNVLYLQNSYTGSRAKLALRDAAGNVKGQANIGNSGALFAFRNNSGTRTLAQVKTSGQSAEFTLFNRAGYETFKAMNNGYLQLMDDKGKLWLTLNAISKEVIRYRGDGTSVVQQLYSTQKVIIDPGAVGSDGLCLKKNVNETFVYGSCGTGGAGTPGGSSGQMQYNRGGSFAGAQLRYSTVSVNTSALKLPSGVNKLEIRNAANRIIMAIYSGARVVIGGS